MARVLVFFLAFLPVCRAEYYDEDGEIHRRESYDSYNEEIKAPLNITTVMEGLTRLKRWDMDDLETLSQEDPIVDVKGVLNNILQGDQSKVLGGPRYPHQHTQSYFYVENAVRDRALYLPNQNHRVFQQWMPTLEVSNRSPSDDKQENTIESSSETVTEQHWSFVYQPETSTNVKNDIIAEVRTLQPIKEGEVPRRFSMKTWFTTEGTESTIDSNNYPQETATYNPSEMQAEVKKLVQHWNPATTADNYPQEVTKYNPSEMQAEVKELLRHWNPATNADNYPQESTKYNPSEMQAEVKKLVQHWRPATNADEKSSSYDSASMRADMRNLDQHWSPSSSVQDMSTSSRVQHRTHTSRVQHRSHTSRVQHRSDTSRVHAVAKSPIPKMNQQKSKMQTVVKLLDPYVPRFKQEHHKPVNFLRNDKSPEANAFTFSNWNDLREGTPTTTPETTIKQPVDIDKIMAIIANLTDDYEWNLTEQFNKSMIEHGVPTCPWKGGEKWGPGGAWTSTTPTTTMSPYDFENTSVVTKCFVCGLTDPEIPVNAHCADAFAGDFMPVMPIDASARGQIAGFRKYCRRLDDVPNYVEDPMDPRAIYGRFTPGCAVRWTDLTGVYTQRTCRIRKRPLMGKHFASKRMAKLELALVNVENGCIISPMATLLPVSRGISLYARFHACVCTGNWCNRAILIKVTTNTVVAFVLYWLLHTWPS